MSSCPKKNVNLGENGAEEVCPQVRSFECNPCKQSHFAVEKDCCACPNQVDRKQHLINNPPPSPQ